MSSTSFQPVNRFPPDQDVDEKQQKRPLKAEVVDIFKIYRKNPYDQKATAFRPSGTRGSIATVNEMPPPETSRAVTASPAHSSQIDERDEDDEEEDPEFVLKQPLESSKDLDGEYSGTSDQKSITKNPQRSKMPRPRQIRDGEEDTHRSPEPASRKTDHASYWLDIPDSGGSVHWSSPEPQPGPPVIDTNGVYFHLFRRQHDKDGHVWDGRGHQIRSLELVILQAVHLKSFTAEEARSDMTAIFVDVLYRSKGPACINGKDGERA